MGSEDGRLLDLSGLTPDDLLTMIRNSERQWDTISLDDPDASLEWAKGLVWAVERLNKLHRGIAVSVRAAGLFLVGNLDRAEKGYYEAAALLDGHPDAEADNFRRMSVLRRTQKSFWEAGRLADQALVLSREHGSREQIGKALLEVGNVHYDTESYQEAADSYVASLDYLDHERPTYIISTHNLTCATVMLGRCRQIPDLANGVQRLRKALPRFSTIQTRLLWLQMIVSIHMGACNHAIRKIPAVISRLRKERATTDDIGTANIDLAQALWTAGEHEKACSALEETRELFASIYGISPGVIEEISTAIDTLRSTTQSTVEPWEIRRRIVTTAAESRWRAFRSAGEE